MVIGPLPALSADTGPLPSGTAAGIKQAQNDNDDPPLLWLVGAGVVIAIGILILFNTKEPGDDDDDPLGIGAHERGRMCLRVWRVWFVLQG